MTAKSTQPKKSSAKAKKDEESDKVSNQNFVPTPKAAKLIEKAKNDSPMSIAGFICECIEEYGPILLRSLSREEEDSISFHERFKYLEDATLEIAYGRMIGKLKGKEIAAHQKLLEKINPSSWTEIKKLTKAAKNNTLTKKTTRLEWQTLVRMKDTFLKSEEDEDNDYDDD